MQIRFLGAADTVTGSRHLVTLGGTRIGLDCGLFQGFKVLRQRNWEPVPRELLEADAIVLSHAHLDHSGWLPVLARQGWNGPVYATPATRDLVEVLLLDSAHLQEEDARRANKGGWSRHERALPLYTARDAQRAIALVRPLPPGREQRVGPATVSLQLAGHLLGAASVRLAHGGERLLFSGDLGRREDLLMRPPEPPPDADVLLVESTYGNRLHPREDAMARLGTLISQTVQRGGSVLMPAFAVGRAQALLLVLQRLKARGEVPARLPIFLDSPMAIEATQLHLRHGRALRVPRRELDTLTEGVRMVTTAAQSMRLARLSMPAVIISASGMATGGRVLHHLARMAPDPRHHLVFAGFQVGGSRGARLVAGATEVKVHGQYVPVRAQVTQLEGFSGHADSDELMDWLRAMRTPPRSTWVVHGEPDAADALRIRIQDELGWRVAVPAHGQVVDA